MEIHNKKCNVEEQKIKKGNKQIKHKATLPPPPPSKKKGGRWEREVGGGGGVGKRTTFFNLLQKKQAPKTYAQHNRSRISSAANSSPQKWDHNGCIHKTKNPRRETPKRKEQNQKEYVTLRNHKTTSTYNIYSST